MDAIIPFSLSLSLSLFRRGISFPPRREKKEKAKERERERERESARTVE